MSDLESTRRLAEITTGGHPDWQATLDGDLWVALGDQDVVRIDAASNAVIASVPVASPCLSLAAAYGSVWSPSCTGNEVDRIDPRTNTIVAHIPVAGIPGHGEGQVAAAFGSVWLFTDEEGTLGRINPTTNKVAATYPLGAAGISIVAAGDHLWATAPDAGAVLEIDTSGHVVATIPVGPGPRFIAAGEGGVWALNQGDGTVARIDPAMGRVVATVAAEVPGNGGCIATGGGSVWVTMPGTPVLRIDPMTNTVVEAFQGDGGDCISFAQGSVWLSNNGQGTVWRIKP
jgi:virginiamycin B lyase